ncbi:MAG: helix-turn-helix domain-containing protein [Candidatus Eremiobacteraeota bacterium]|nr:helix-turn-helix domain-containing protein [Candidatus Eremiobacteraeota bacterium]
MGRNTAGSPFGRLLREFRLAAGLSQEALAERATMSADGISALERGINKAPQRETLGLLLEALALSPEQRHAIGTAAERPSKPRTVSGRPAKASNLPRVPSPLVGREREMREVRDFVAASQLVTLVGAGGVGKTRLALEVGHALSDEWPDGVFFVDFAPATNEYGVAAALAQVLEIREHPDRALLAAVVNVLAHKKVLLIFDNCEQVVAPAAAAIEAICAGCPDVHILATSRQPLLVPGEQNYRVASLDAPAAFALFIANAKRADSSFSLDETERTTVERICRRLDGIALAIELAAARAKMLGLSQIDELLSERFAVLTGGQIRRHQTMRALVDWSYDLLAAEERLLFVRLAVFSAEFSFEAARVICSGDGMVEGKVLDTLGSLVDKSLVTSEQRGRARRFRLLETMRAYVLEKVGDQIEPLNRKHAKFYLTFLQGLDSRKPGWSEHFEVEYENLRQASAWSIDGGNDVSLGVQLLWQMREFLLLRGFGAEAARRAERALHAAQALPAPVEAMAWETLSAIRGDNLLPTEALEAATRALALYEELGDNAGVARTLRGCGVAYLRLGMFAEAETALQRSLDLTKVSGDWRELARTLGSIAVSLEMTGRLDEARQTSLEVLSMAVHNGDERMSWVSLMNLAETEFVLGEIESAVNRLAELLANKTARKNVRLRAHTKSNLAAYLIALRREGEARAVAREAVFDAREAGDSGILACALGHLAALWAPLDPRNAARLLGYVERVFASGYQREHTERYTHEILTNALRQALTETENAALEREGALMSENQAVHLGTRGFKRHVAEFPTK